MNKIRNLIKVNLQRFATMTTGTGSLSDEMKTFYDKALITLTDPNLVHDQFADKRPIPKNGGKTIEFRKYSPLAKATTPITEGATPSGNSMTVSAITATIAQYGDYIVLSDLLDLTAIDNNVVEATKMLGSQAGRTLDTITREVVSGGTNVIYAPKSNGDAVVSRYGLDATCKMTADLAFKAATQLEAMNAPKIDGSYVAIIHPYSAYDLQRDSNFIDAHKYSDAKTIFKGELGEMGGVRFVKSSEAKIWKAANLTAAARNLTVKTTATNATVAVDEAITAGEATALAGRKIIINGVQHEIDSASAGVAGSATITLTASASVTDGQVIYPGEGSATGLATFSTLFLGANAYGVTDVEGGGLQHIVKQLGYGDDPLNQRSSCGWKATKVAKRLVEEYMVRVESCGTYGSIAEAN